MSSEDFKVSGISNASEESKNEDLIATGVLAFELLSGTRLFREQLLEGYVENLMLLPNHVLALHGKLFLTQLITCRNNNIDTFKLLGDPYMRL